MRPVFEVLAAVPAALFAALLYFYALFFVAMSLLTARNGGHLDLRPVPVALCLTAAGSGCLAAALHIATRRSAAVGCLAIAILLFTGGMYLMYDLAYKPQTGAMASSDGGFVFVFGAAMALLGALGLIGSTPVLVRSFRNPRA